jgi:hypothetical protein
MKIFSIPLNPKLSEEEFVKFYEFCDKYKDYIYDIYFTCRIPPFVTDAMGDVFDGKQAVSLINNALILQDNLKIPLSATFNNIEIPPTQEFLDTFIKFFKPIYDQGIRTVTLPHTIWMLSGKIQKEYPDLFVKNTILRNVQRANEIVKLVEAGFSYINLDRDLMRDRNQLLEIKKAKEYCIKKYGRDIKVSLLANEGCWGNCSVQDEHFQYNNTRIDGKHPTYFMTQLSKFTCTAWDRDDPGQSLKKADLPPWREDWLEFVNNLGIDVFKMHGREHIPRLFETMKIIENFANNKEILFDGFETYIDDMSIEGSPINAWRKKIKTCKFDCWDCNYCNQVVVSKSKNRFVEKINESLKRAQNNESKLSDEILAINGLTSFKVKHFVNNLLEINDARYLEVGVYQGSIFSSAMYKNEHAYCIGVDNFENDNLKPMRDIEEWTSVLGPTKSLLYQNISKTKNKNYKIIDKSVQELVQDDLPFKASIVFYDGDHSLASHETFIETIKDFCDDIFILIVDDWNWLQVAQGTKNCIDKIGVKKIFEKEIFTTGEDPNDFWNGLGIYVLEKQ